MSDSPLFPVIYEDESLLVLHKPAGLVCHPTKGDARSSLVSRVRLYLGADLEPQMVHRLDRETSGVMVFGKTSEAAAELRRLWEMGFATKEYLAIVEGRFCAESNPRLEAGRGVIDAPLGPEPDRVIAIKDAVRADGVRARTRYQVLQEFRIANEIFTGMRVWLDTGRKHQIRIHFASMGHPVVGDKLYGPDPDAYLNFVKRCLTSGQKARLRLPNHALHARRLWFPWNGAELEFCSPPEQSWKIFVRGEPVPWERDPYDPLRCE